MCNDQRSEINKHKLAAYYQKKCNIVDLIKTDVQSNSQEQLEIDENFSILKNAIIGALAIIIVIGILKLIGQIVI